MGQPPLCFDCDKEIPFDRYQLGICVECEKERNAMNDPNWHRSSEDQDEVPSRNHLFRDHELDACSECGAHLCCGEDHEADCCERDASHD